jgi:hypothetical protein
VLIALLAVLGVDLVVLIAFAALVLGRRRWLKRQPGEFVGAVRLSSGDIDGLKPKWKRGSGRWVRDVFVWSSGPLMLRNSLLPVDRLLSQQPANAGDVRRLGDTPVIIEFAIGDATITVAARHEHRALAVGPFAASADPTV